MKLIDKILLSEIKPYAWTVSLIILLILLTVGFEALAPWPFRILIDNVLGNLALDPATFQGKLLGFINSREALGFFVVMVYGISSMLVSVTEYFSNVLSKRLSREIIFDFSHKAFVNLEQLAVGFYRQQQIGDYIYRLSYDVSALGNIIEAGIIPAITNSLYLITTILILFWLNVQLAWIALAMLPLLALALYIFNHSIGDATKRSERSNSALFSLIQEVLSQLKIIQAFNRERKQAVAFDSRQNESLKNEYIVYILSFMLDLVIGVIIALGYALIIMYGIRAVYLKDMSTGALIIFIFYLDNLTNPVLSIMNAASSIKEDYVKVARMKDFFVSQNRIEEQGTAPVAGVPGIIFEDVSVYAEGGSVILKNASFKIPAGKRTVIVGVSGSGKTTISSLILRFLDHGKGRILFGDKDIREYSVRELRDAIAYVPQEITLFDDTVRANIDFGSRSTQPQVRKAAELAVAHQFISRLPGAYDFVVGEEGINLSGGQRQRIMIARAFLKTAAPVWIFDEPFSALDVKTRSVLAQNISSLGDGKTVIIISNVLEIIDTADYVIMVNEGEILHAGERHGLLAQDRLSKLILSA